MSTLTSVEYAQRHGTNVRYVRRLAQQGRIPGATKRGRDWHIPEDAPCVILRPGRPRSALPEGS